MTKVKILRLSAVALVLWGISSCTTQKNTWLTRTFHNTCAHYNGYFWGKLAFDEGVDNLNQTHKDDYTDIIPVYVYPDPPEAPVIYPNMSRAIKKADTMIQKHTITDRSKHEIPDAVKYIKYCYLLLAQAHLYKNDLLEASDALEYATKEYRKLDFKYEALIWEVRTYDQLGSVSKAEEIVDLLRASMDKKIPRVLVPQVFAVVADWNMRIGQYPEVEAQLKKALKYEKNKKTKARYNFIIGQLEEREGDNQKAYESYTQCLKLHPYNELDFEARIKRALLYMGGAKENEKIKDNLYKMLKPTKYIDNRDQIYYALAEIALKEGNQELAVTDLRKSIKVSTTNKVQKAISFLALGNIAFDHENYKAAKKFYDSTIVSLPKKYRGRDTILAKKDNLDKLVRYLNLIDREDSLQKIATRGQSGAEKYVDSIIADEKKKDEEKTELEKRLADSAQNSQNTAAVSNGKWYFYNPSAVSQGIAEFTQHWGNRPLEDNWRRSHKIADNLQTNTNETSDTSKKAVALKKDSNQEKSIHESYMKNIPFTPAKMKASNDTLIEAYYNVGFIYKEYFKNYPRAEEDFEELITRFPDNKYKLIVYYDLCLLYKQTGDNIKSDYYKNILLTKYPDTEYALLLKDPEKYRQQLEASRQQILKIYETTLQSYKNANYAEVLNDCAQVDSLYPKNFEMPKFAFMEASAIGHEKGIEAYKNALEKVVIEYPKDTIKAVAQSILDYLNKKNRRQESVPVLAKTDTVPVVYSKDEDTVFYYILTIDNKQSSKVNTVRNAITDMNTKIYSENNFTMEDIFLNSNQQMLVVHKFSSAARAKDYYNYITTNPDLLKSIPPDSYQSFYISDKNYHILFKHGKSDEYLQFFKGNLK